MRSVTQIRVGADEDVVDLRRVLARRRLGHPVRDLERVLGVADVVDAEPALKYVQNTSVALR